MQVRTPNGRGVQFVNETLVANLMKQGRREGLGFYVDKVEIGRFGALAQVEPQTGGTRRTGSYGPRRTSGGTWGGSSGSSMGSRLDMDKMMGRSSSGTLKPGEQQYGQQGPMVKDPLTDEDMATDWVCEVRFAIVLGAPGEAPAGLSPARQPAQPLRRQSYPGAKPGE
jgi:hypothetical protein